MPLRLPIPAVQRLPKPLPSSWTRKLWRTLQPPGGGGGGRTSVGRYRLCVLVLILLCPPCLAECPDQCECKWKGGKETVECNRAGMYRIPNDLDTGTQVLDLSENNLQVLPKDTFVEVGLVHLQKIYLRHCNIIQIDKEAFLSLSNLVELDISHNHLEYVPSWAFREATQLRRLYINHNPLQKIQQDAFSNMPSLELLELSHCQIKSVESGAFEGTHRLSKLKLDGNHLQTLGDKVVTPLGALHELHLHDNPWMCDCRLQSLREWMTDKNVRYSVPPTCSLPMRFKGRTWSDLQLEDYACEPSVTLQSTSINVLEGENVTLSCHVTGNPDPQVWWLWQGTSLANSSAFGSGHLLLSSDEGMYSKSSNLTITVAEKSDSGVYSCVAENHASAQSANVTLTVGREATEVKGLAVSHITGIAAGIAAVIVLLIVVLCVLTLKCKPVPMPDHKKMDSNHKLPNSMNHKGRMEEQDLSLLGPNPIQKPPRLGQYHSVPTIDLDHYDRDYLPNSTPAMWKTQVVVELEKEVEAKQEPKGLKMVQGDVNKGELLEEEEEEDDDVKFKDMCLKPIVEEEGGSRESEEGDDSGLELDRGRETEVRLSDADSDRERLQEKNRKNQEKRAPICLRDPSTLERELIGIPGMTREKLRQNRPVVQRGGSGGGGDSTCSSSDPPTVPSSPQRQSHTPTDAKVLSLVVPSVLLSCPRTGRLSSFEDEGEDGTEV